MLAKKLMLSAFALSVAACAATPPAPTAAWRLNAAACPDLVEDRLDRRENRWDRREDVRDRRVDRGPLDRAEDRRDSRENRRDRREDRRDRRVVNCPASAYTYVGPGPRPGWPARVVHAADGGYYAEYSDGRRVVIVVDR